MTLDSLEYTTKVFVGLHTMTDRFDVDPPPSSLSSPRTALGDIREATMYRTLALLPKSPRPPHAAEFCFCGIESSEGIHFSCVLFFSQPLVLNSHDGTLRPNLCSLCYRIRGTEPSDQAGRGEGGSPELADPGAGGPPGDRPQAAVPGVRRPFQWPRR